MLIRQVENYNIEATTDPTVSDDYSLNFDIGCFWKNTVTNKLFICVDNTVDNAEWLQIDKPSNSTIGTKIKVNDLIPSIYPHTLTSLDTTLYHSARWEITVIESETQKMRCDITCVMSSTDKNFIYTINDKVLFGTFSGSGIKVSVEYDDALDTIHLCLLNRTTHDIDVIIDSADWTIFESEPIGNKTFRYDLIPSLTPYILSSVDPIDYESSRWEVTIIESDTQKMRCDMSCIYNISSKEVKYNIRNKVLYGSFSGNGIRLYSEYDIGTDTIKLYVLNRTLNNINTITLEFLS